MFISKIQNRPGNVKAIDFILTKFMNNFEETSFATMKCNFEISYISGIPN